MHSHSHPHAHSHGTRAFATVTLVNLAYTALEAGYGFATNSLVLLSDALHNLGDVLGLALGWFGWPAVLLGVITAVGGGLIRDVMTGTTPPIFQRGELYAFAALGTSLTVVVMRELDVARGVIVFAALAGAGLLRRAGALRDDERVVVFNTGAGWLYRPAAELPGG